MIRVVTDSSCDLPSDTLERHRIALVSIRIRFGDDVFTDREDLDRAAFWDRVAAGDKPEIEAPPADAFRDTFVRLEAEGADGIVCLTASGALGGVHAAAQAAAAGFRSGIPVAVVDSRLTSAALGLAAIAAAAAATSMAPIDEIEAATRRAAAACRLVAAPDGTRHARRMRRIGAVRSLLSRSLDRHPLVTITDGALVPAGHVRGREPALEALAGQVAAVDPNAVTVVHADAPDIDLLVERLDAVTDAERVILPMGPAFGSLVGPGAVGVATRAAG